MMNEIQNIVNKVHTLLNNKELQEIFDKIYMY